MEVITEAWSLNSTLVHPVSTLLCFLYTRLFGICLLLYGRVSGINRTRLGEKWCRDGQVLPLAGWKMVSSSTHKFPSGHRFATAGGFSNGRWSIIMPCNGMAKNNKEDFVEGRGRISCLAGTL